VKTIDVIREQHKYTIVMEFMQSGDLYQWRTKKKGAGGCSERDIASIFRKICLGVEALHERGIAHRDIKLENILVQEVTLEGGVTVI
jgi:serine/threonine protein kinase